jgi:hypothetical protein
MLATVLAASELTGQRTGWPSLLALVALGAAVYGVLIGVYYRAEVLRALSFGRRRMRAKLLPES